MLLTGKGMERLAYHVVRIPGRQIEDWRSKFSQVWDVIELHTKNSLGIDALIQQFINDLVQQGRLSNLSRPSQYRDRRKTLQQPFQDRRVGPAPDHRHVVLTFTFPPRICVSEIALCACSQQSFKRQLLHGPPQNSEARLGIKRRPPSPAPRPP